MFQSCVSAESCIFVHAFITFDENHNPEMKNYLWLYATTLLFLCSCSATRRAAPPRNLPPPAIGEGSAGYIRSTVILKRSVPEVVINTGKVKPFELLAFARQQLGVPYVYGGVDSKKGFDCSGFINYVFGHFSIHVPRVSYMFTNAGVDIPIEFSKPGDIILFTGSDAASGIVGHMGIITRNEQGNVEFIHASTSNGVMISGMNSYFIPRYVRVNRIFIPSVSRSAR